MARILVVDDNKIVRDLLRGVLERAGYEVREAQDGVAALDLAQQAAFDVLITDLVMPGPRGTELLERFRSTLPDLKVIAMSGYYADDELNDAPQDVEFLRKPFDHVRLLHVIKQAIGANRQHIGS
jgi:CheY-like chemotaxis protein